MIADSAGGLRTASPAATIAAATLAASILGAARTGAGAHVDVRRDVDVEPRNDVGELPHHHRAHALHLDVVDSRNEMALAHAVRARFVRQQLGMAATDELVERRTRLDAQDPAEHVQRKLRKLERFERDAERPQLPEDFLIVLLPVGVARLFMKCRFEITDAQAADIERRIPVERQVEDTQVLFVGLRDRVEHDRAVFDSPAQRSDAILRPRERHRAVAAHAAECRSKTRDAADRRRAENRSARFRADAEGDASGGRRTRRSGRRSTRAFGRIPRIVGAATEPLIAACQFAGRKLGHEHRARLAQQAHDGCFRLERLAFERARSPLRGIAGYRNDVLASPRNPVQRSAVPARSDFAVGFARLVQRELVGEGDDEVESRVVVTEPRLIHFGQLD